MVDRHEPDVRADAHHRPAGPAAPDVQSGPRSGPARASSTSGSGTSVASIGAFILAIGVLLFLINVVHTHRKAPAAPLDPWDARTLEWMTTSPPKEHNFDASRRCTPSTSSSTASTRTSAKATPTTCAGWPRPRRSSPSRRPTPTTTSTCRRRRTGRSCWRSPCRSSAFGVIYSHFIAVVGAVILVLAAFGWALEPSVADDSDYDPPPSDEGPAPSWRRWGAPDERADDAAGGEDAGPWRPGPRQRAERGDERRHRDDRRDPDGRPARARGRAVDESATPSTQRADRDARGHADGHHGVRTAPPGSPTTSWRCGSSSVRSACCSAD